LGKRRNVKKGGATNGWRPGGRNAQGSVGGKTELKERKPKTPQEIGVEAMAVMVEKKANGRATEVARCGEGKYFPANSGSVRKEVMVIDKKKRINRGLKKERTGIGGTMTWDVKGNKKGKK